MEFQVDTKLYIWFLVVLSLYIIVISSFNIYYYGKIRSQYNAQPDVIQDVGKGWANAMWGLNIALLVISILVFIVQLIKGISGKATLGISAWISKWFKGEPTAEETIAKTIKDKSISEDCIRKGVEAALMFSSEGVNSAENRGTAMAMAMQECEDARTVAEVVADLNKTSILDKISKYFNSKKS
jgi:hypothetical protein